MLREANKWIRNVDKNFDCDRDGHRYNTHCRKCEAKALANQIDALLASQPATPAEPSVESILQKERNRLAAELAQVTRERDEAHDILRSLAAYVGSGGYNAIKVDAKRFAAKIRDGIDTHVRVQCDNAARALLAKYTLTPRTPEAK